MNKIGVALVLPLLYFPEDCPKDEPQVPTDGGEETVVMAHHLETLLQ